MATPKLTSREAIIKREAERAEGKRDASQAFRDEVLASLVEELRDQGKNTRDLIVAIRELSTASNELRLAVLELSEELRRSKSPASPGVL